MALVYILFTHLSVILLFQVMSHLLLPGVLFENFCNNVDILFRGLFYILYLRGFWRWIIWRFVTFIFQFSISCKLGLLLLECYFNCEAWSLWLFLLDPSWILRSLRNGPLALNLITNLSFWTAKGKLDFLGTWSTCWNAPLLRLNLFPLFLVFQRWPGGIQS